MGPILANTSYQHGRDTCTLRVFGGLHYLRGNSAPYFSITAEGRRNGREDVGGCCHGLIEARFPGRFSDLIALHLSDINGAPMYAEVNGWYQLAGACGGLGERYHSGNAKRQHWKGEPDEFGEREFDGYREPTADECLASFAEHCRVSVAEAAAIRESCLGPAARTTPAGVYHVSAIVRAEWVKQCDAMRPRWKAEADACIARHGLKVYGDTWRAA